ncbi:MAG: hypothetical protein WC390_12185 [Sulfurimonas sp.]
MKENFIKHLLIEGLMLSIKEKSFFNVDLLEIRIKVSEVIGLESEFVMTAIAEDYYETRKLRKVA